MFELMATAAAAAGAALLDEKEPGWFNEIDTSKLNIERLDECVLGQLYGEYSDGLYQLFGSVLYENAPGHGFDIQRVSYELLNLSDHIVACSAFFTALNRAWKYEIATRVKAENARRQDYLNSLVHRQRHLALAS